MDKKAGRYKGGATGKAPAGSAGAGRSSGKGQERGRSSFQDRGGNTANSDRGRSSSRAGQEGRPQGEGRLGQSADRHRGAGRGQERDRAGSRERMGRGAEHSARSYNQGRGAGEGRQERVGQERDGAGSRERMERGAERPARGYNQGRGAGDGRQSRGDSRGSVDAAGGNRGGRGRDGQGQERNRNAGQGRSGNDATSARGRDDSLRVGQERRRQGEGRLGQGVDRNRSAGRERDHAGSRERLERGDVEHQARVFYQGQGVGEGREPRRDSRGPVTAASEYRGGRRQSGPLHSKHQVTGAKQTRKPRKPSGTNSVYTQYDDHQSRAGERRVLKPSDAARENTEIRIPSEARLGGEQTGSYRTDKSKLPSDQPRAPKPSKGKRVDAPVAVGQTVYIDVVGIGHSGEGVGRTDEGYTLFVHGALPGERVRAKVDHVKKQYGYAKLVEVVSRSGERVEAPCPVYAECGGCQLQHLSYEGQLQWKRQTVVDALERIGKLENVTVHPTLGMDEPWRYRNKAQVPICQEEGGLVGGFYAQGTHRIIDMKECLIQHERNDEVVGLIKRLAAELGIRAYDETTGRGLLRHVVVKVGFRTGDVMVVLVTNGADIQRVDELIGLIQEELPAVRSIVQNINTAQTNVIFGDRTEVLWGEEYIRDYIGDIQFAISARSFYQVNPVQTEVLYGKALEYAALTGNETVIDAYCGIGTISLFLAQHADHVYGVEIVPDAITDARRNADLNDLTSKVTFEVGPAEVIIPGWQRKGIHADVIVVDPPRKGCDAALLDTIGQMQPRRVVYVSCNPATLARDLRILEDAGYRTVEVQPVDMFPHTVHVEVTVRLERKDTVQ